jgi:hypothetical protein
MRIVGVTVAVAGAMLSVLVPSGVAAAAEVSCTDTITTPIALSSDLHCSGSGPVVQGPDGSLDLAGHRIVGSGTGVGVQINDDGSLSNGSVTNFETGVLVQGGGGDATLTHLRVTRNSSTGIRSQGSILVTVEGTSVRKNAGRAMSLERGLVKDSLVAKNGGGVLGVTGLTVQRSVVRHNDGAGISGGDFALRLEDSVVVGNDEGVALRGLFGSTIRRNWIGVHTSGAGIEATFRALDRSTIEGNVFARNLVGIISHQVGPISAPGRIAGNLFVGNLAAGMWLEDPEGIAVPADARVKVIGNIFKGNGFASGGLVDNAGRSVNDGLHLNVEGIGVVVRDNFAHRNAGFGIEAYDDVIDGGGNTARHNGESAQCLGVVCS